jgi:peptide/nickel transport system substrate-binding protein
MRAGTRACLWGATLLALLWAAAGAAAFSPLTESLTGGRYGGTLTALDEGDFEHLDPGQAYYSVDYGVVYATQRPLYSPKPNSLEPVPDLASGPPVISPDGMTVSVKIRTGVRFSPPVNREVTSADVAYAIERGTNPNVANPYIDTYFGAVAGLDHSSGGPVPGILTPNRHEIVFRLTRPVGWLLSQALSLPLTAPVPRGYARRFDRHSPSDYWAHEVATGPYMIANDRSGTVLGRGYEPGRSLSLVRNPNWRRSTDIRPAYLNAIHIRIGSSNAIIGREVLAGRDLVANEPPTQGTVRAAVEGHPAQLEISPGAGSHYISLNNAHGPFRNVDLRKALFAALDRKAMNEVRGGPGVAGIATHFLYPTFPGFQESGGLAGPSGDQFDFDQHPEGDLALAESYMRQAGYPSGRYTGNEQVKVIGVDGPPAEQDAEIVNATLLRLGFVTKFKTVETATMYAEYCDVPKAEVDVCPNVGWIGDFPDPQAVLGITFDGNDIVPSGNVNWSQADVPAINAQMSAAEVLTNPAEIDQAWAKIDDDLVEQAVAIPFDWDSEANVEGRNVDGVGDVWNVGTWDYSWTSLR